MYGWGSLALGQNMHGESKSILHMQHDGDGLALRKERRALYYFLGVVERGGHV